MSFLLRSVTITLLISQALASGVSVTRNILSDDAYEVETTPFVSKRNPHRKIGKVRLFPSFVEKLRTASGIPDENEVTPTVQTTILTSSSARHEDRYGDKSPVRDGKVGILFLNSNEDAFFSHGDASVPIKEGSFVQFEGHVPHNTVVKSGMVSMIGPFHLPSFKDVGSAEEEFECEGCDSNDHCQEEEAPFCRDLYEGGVDVSPCTGKQPCECYCLESFCGECDFDGDCADGKTCMDDKDPSSSCPKLVDVDPSEAVDVGCGTTSCSCRSSPSAEL